MANSTRRRRPRKTLSRHSLTKRKDGRWCKRLNGQMHYFGRDEQKALELWEAQKDALMAHREPEPAAPDEDDLQLKELCHRFLFFKEQLMPNELTARTFGEYVATAKRLVRVFGETRLVTSIKPPDFAKLRADISETWGLVRLSNEMVRVRSFFKWGFDEGLLKTPVRFGQSFKRPKAADLDKLRASKRRMFEKDEILAMLDAAGPVLRCMILLGANAAFGNDDCAGLPLTAVDLSGNWIAHARAKTGTFRRCKLWPETAEALKTVLANRKSTDGNLVFLTKYGNPWTESAIGHELAKLLKKLDIKKDGLNFYGLRRGFRTVGGGSRDMESVNIVMGHRLAGVGGKHYVDYVHGFQDERLEVVSEHVRNWLFAERHAGPAVIGRIG